MSGGLSREDLEQERAEAKAEQLGMQIIHPEHDELFVDLDSVQARCVFDAKIEDVRNFVGVRAVAIKKSPSRQEGHFHAYVKLNRDINCEYERILLQLLRKAVLHCSLNRKTTVSLNM